MIFDAQGSDEDDGIAFSLGTDTDLTMFSIKDNSGTVLGAYAGHGGFMHNMGNQAAADFTFYGGNLSGSSTHNITYEWRADKTTYFWLFA